MSLSQIWKVLEKSRSKFGPDDAGTENITKTTTRKEEVGNKQKS